MGSHRISYAGSALPPGIHRGPATLLPLSNADAGANAKADASSDAKARHHSGPDARSDCHASSATRAEYDRY